MTGGATTCSTKTVLSCDIFKKVIYLSRSKLMLRNVKCGHSLVVAL